ncbi:hypothetical protein FIV50_17295 [Microbacterium foliorum]|uniref:Uncharacterized protein n=1 Tax=Microbacterium foliorum TaxID=104336 RepID=A0A4Y5YVH2_9MICO|nr:hypothetical protein [Microbacterium foliorum]QDE36383.1 hypothetical protein FIV50_17295 [Microbacterium foliorum]
MTEDPRRLRWAVNGARTFRIPAEAADVALVEIDRAMQAAHFRADAPGAEAGVQRLYRRGSVVGDVLIGGSGLSALTTRLGPLSARGVAVTWIGPVDANSICVIVSLVAGSHVGGDFVDGVDDAVHALVSRGIPVEDEGWSRSVDVDQTLPANPRRAAELGLTR